MNLFRKQLLATAAAGLTLAFSGVAEAQVQKQAPPAPAVNLQTLTTLYHTQDLKVLAALEARLNQEKPAAAPRIVYIDPDVMATWLQLKGSVAAYPAMTAEYLNAKKVTGINNDGINALASLSFSMRSGAAVPEAAGKDLSQTTCVVVPYNPNLSADAFMRGALNLVNPRTHTAVNAGNGLKLNISISRQDMEEIIDAREAWGCFDTKFIAQVGQTKGFDQVMALHRATVFQDVGGLMQAVKDGADPSLITKFADFRAASAALTTHGRGSVFSPSDMPFYGSVVDETSPALADLKARIDQMGVEKFRALSGDDLVKLADDITDKSALTSTQATHIMGFAMLGAGYFRTLETAKADPAAVDEAKRIVTATLTRQDDAVKQSVQPMTPEEMLKSALVPAVTPDLTYGYLQNEIFGDAGVQKDPADPVARFRVHEQLIDKTRTLMDQHPESESLIRQVLQGIFLSSPMMDKAPPPKVESPVPRHSVSVA